MASGAKYFILNRKSDWLNSGIVRNMDFKNDVMVSKVLDGENAVYISCAFDSLELNTIWHRMRLDLKVPPNTVYKLKVYAADTAEIFVPMPGVKGRVRADMNEYILDANVDINRKLDLFEDIGAMVYKNSTDVLLYGLKGRYLWFCLEFINYGKEDFKINSVKIEFPQVTFVNYLPEMYRTNEQNNSFIERFLGIFQSIYVDLEDKIDYTPRRFDVDYTTKDFLMWIGDWLSVKDATLWGEKKLRRVIKQAISIYKIKGTKKAVAKMVQEYAGIEPIIVEQFDVKENMHYEKQKNVIENLFGDNGYVFTVMIPESHVKDNESYVELLRVINSVKPVDSICNLVVLNDQIYLDNHCYIGMNSFITKNEKMILDKNHRETNNLMLETACQ